MCGISGLANWGNREALARMTAVQSHRGPNDSGMWDHHSPDGSYFGLGSRRLSILDLTPDGHMPMSNENGTVWITYNGEIYNFADLRRELEGKGHRFASHTDTEVIIHLYEEMGPDCVMRLNGMFAFAICDLRSGSPVLFMARDHFGIKPFYYAHHGNRLAFASEAKALLEVPGVDAAIDFESLDQYLTFLWVPDPKTLFKGIVKLGAGHRALFRDGRLEISQYWDLSFPPADHDFGLSEENLANEIRERFRYSVEQQMVSDVPLGAFLSAGLDSSSIVALMARTAKRPLRTYTITFPEEYRKGENALDDPAVAARLAKHLGCENRQIVVEPKVADLLPKLCWHMDEPTADPAIVAAYLVCREASKDVTVLLSGVGGDELFAGYRKYSAHYWARFYSKMPRALRDWAESTVEGIPNLRGSRFKGPVRLLKKMLRSAALEPRDRFIANGTYLDSDQRSKFYSHASRREIESCAPDFQHHAHQRLRPARPASRLLRPRARSRFPEPNALRRHQGVHGELEPHLQRQDEHGFFGRGPGAVLKSRAGRVCGLECAAASEIERPVCSHDQTHSAQGNARGLARRSLKSAQGRLCCSDGLLAGPRPAGDDG